MTQSASTRDSGVCMRTGNFLSALCGFRVLCVLAAQAYLGTQWQKVVVMPTRPEWAMYIYVYTYIYIYLCVFVYMYICQIMWQRSVT